MSGVSRLSVPERFWPKVDRSDPSGCWLWTAYRDENGYGKFYLNGTPAYAHRVAYELTVGPVPPRLTLDHLCRNPSCVRPTHLEPVTQRVNILRGTGQSALHAVKTQCPNGHPYDEENTYWYGGHRECRTCNRTRAAMRVPCPTCGKLLSYGYRATHQRIQHGYAIVTTIQAYKALVAATA